MLHSVILCPSTGQALHRKWTIYIELKACEEDAALTGMQDRNGKKGLYSLLIVSCKGRIRGRLPEANESVSLLYSLPFATQQPIPGKPTTALGELSSHRQRTKSCIYKHGAWAHLLTSLGKVSHVCIRRLGNDTSCRGVGTAQRLNQATLRLRTFF